MACNAGPIPACPTSGGSFNPWRVFSWLATISLCRAAAAEDDVSIPGGFFRGLQPRSRCRTRPPSYSGFNPWRVFSWLATYPIMAGRAGDLRSFNPWRVFSWLATLGISPACQYGAVLFQSLAGFFVACNPPPLEPILRELQVSIPGGFFRGLQLSEGRCTDTWAYRFQSLAGFFVACNKVLKGDIEKAVDVSIPGGFFRGLQLGRGPAWYTT